MYVGVVVLLLHNCCIFFTLSGQSQGVATTPWSTTRAKTTRAPSTTTTWAITPTTNTCCHFFWKKIACPLALVAKKFDKKCTSALQCNIPSGPYFHSYVEVTPINFPYHTALTTFRSYHEADLLHQNRSRSRVRLLLLNTNSISTQLW